MSNNLIKLFSDIKSQCKTRSQRLAFNKFVKSFDVSKHFVTLEEILKNPKAKRKAIFIVFTPKLLHNYYLSSNCEKVVTSCYNIEKAYQILSNDKETGELYQFTDKYKATEFEKLLILRLCVQYGFVEFNLDKEINDLEKFSIKLV